MEPSMNTAQLSVASRNASTPPAVVSDTLAVIISNSLEEPLYRCCNCLDNSEEGVNSTIIDYNIDTIGIRNNGTIAGFAQEINCGTTNHGYLYRNGARDNAVTIGAVGTSSTKNDELSFFLPLNNKNCNVSRETLSSPLLQVTSSDHVSRVFWSRLITGASVFIFSVFCQCFVAIWSDQYYKTGTPRLHDRIHDLLGGHPPSFLKPVVVNAFCTVLLVATVVKGTIFMPWHMRFTIWTRWLIISSVLYWMRSLCIIVTTLPCPIETCKPLRPNSFSQMVAYSIKEIVGGVYECTDLVVSGHTLSATSMVMVWIYYNTKPRWLTFVAVLYGLFCLILIDVSFFHYTIDIVVGVFFAVGMWSIYHLLLDLAIHRYSHTGSFYRRNEAVENVRDGPLLYDNVDYTFSDGFGVIGDFMIRAIVFMEGLNVELRYAEQTNIVATGISQIARGRKWRAGTLNCMAGYAAGATARTFSCESNSIYSKSAKNVQNTVMHEDKETESLPVTRRLQLPPLPQEACGNSSHCNVNSDAAFSSCEGNGIDASNYTSSYSGVILSEINMPPSYDVARNPSLVMFSNRLVAIGDACAGKGNIDSFF